MMSLKNREDINLQSGGAAGGIPFGFHCVFDNLVIKSGIQMLAELSGLEEKIA